MLDCGVHPGFKGPASLPFFDSTDIDQVDVMLITHFHLDHVAAMPYVVTKTDFKVCNRPTYVNQVSSVVLPQHLAIR
jgi:Cft2 family RNA processing exonuclease